MCFMFPVFQPPAHSGQQNQPCLILNPKQKLIFCLYSLQLPNCRSQWPRGLRRRSFAVRLLRLWVRIPPEAWMFVCCECCVLSGRGLCDRLITRPEESYRLWRVVVCDQETYEGWNFNSGNYLFTTDTK